MARPMKVGLDYFPLDVNFLNDIKVKRILRSYGAQSVAVLIQLLCTIYRDEGYYMEWNSDIAFLISDDVRISEQEVNNIVLKAVEVNFFNKNIFELYNILTSEGIQSRYSAATERRKDNEIMEKINLIDKENKCLQKHKLSEVNVDNNSVNVNNNSINVDNNSVNVDGNEQSKVKKSKEKKSKEYSTSKETKNNRISQSDLDRIIEKWNSIDNIPKLTRLRSNTDRYKMLKARINEYGIEEVLKALDEVEKSDFLKGYEGNTGWQFKFEWFVKPNNFIKVYEGQYRNKGGTQNGYAGNGTKNKPTHTGEEKPGVKVLDFS